MGKPKVVHSEAKVSPNILPGPTWEAKVYTDDGEVQTGAGDTRGKAIKSATDKIK